MSGAAEWIHDRFTVCLVTATALHAAVVFGITFGVSIEPPPKIVETLEVVLVNWRSEETPEEPDFLAQAAQRGGGYEEEEKSRPANPLSGMFPNPNLGEEVMQGDAAIDEREIEVEEECLKLLALHQPVAADLRFVIAVLKVNNDLERAGDLAGSIAKRAVLLAKSSDMAIPGEPWKSIKSMVIPGGTRGSSSCNKLLVIFCGS